MTRRTRCGRKKRMSRDYIRGLAGARLELIFKHAFEEQHYEIALEAVKAHCRLFGIRIDGPGRPRPAPIISPEVWQKMLTDAERRRVS